MKKSVYKYRKNHKLETNMSSILYRLNNHLQKRIKEDTLNKYQIYYDEIEKNINLN